MARTEVRYYIFLLLFLLFAQPVWAQTFPSPEGYVSDFAGILSPDARSDLENQLVALEKDSSIEIAVVTVESLEETTIEDYAVRLFEAWGIGKKDADNGVLLLVAPNERELRIEVGYGLEPTLTDSKAGRIIRNIITPEFKEGDYDRGISAGVEAIIKVVHGEGVDLGAEGSSGEESGEVVWILFAIGMIFLSYLASFLARSKRWWPGGVIGAILGVILGIWLASILIAILVALGLGILGLIFDCVLSRNYRVRMKRGLSTSWWGSGGGFFGGGGGGGGGFSGFGRGASGGGGASGKW